MEPTVNLLIVDDKDTNVLLLTELLKSLKINLITASSGQEALAITKGIDLALALIDVQMPGMNGYEMAVELNKERAEPVPVIFITASYPDNSQILRGYEAGAVDYIVKPFVTKVLISKVKVFIRLYLQKQETLNVTKELRQISEFLSEANKELILKDEEYRALLNASPDGVLLINSDGVFEDLSRSAMTLFGANDPKAIINKKYMKFVASGQKEKIKKIKDQLKSDGLALNYEILLKKADQSYFPSEISVAHIERQHRSSINYMLLVRDISERKIIESQLIHSERLASLGEMASGMAHEINQPLNTISLVLDNMILEASQNEVLSKDYFEKKSYKIFESIQRIKNMIDHVRIFSRSKSEAPNAPFDINESIRNAISLMNEQIRLKGINLVATLKEGLPFHTGNTFELEQVIINMISNAEDALLEKSRMLRRDYGMFIRLFTYTDSKNIYIDIEDNGTGIKEENKDRIFQPFFSTKESGKGTGLGLSISYTIVKNMKGSIQVESESMKGTTFRIIFPMKNTEEK